MDIAAIDGVPVNSEQHRRARASPRELNELDAQYRPTEIGSPWAIGPAPPYFTDADHADHIHVGFDDEIDPDWKPPAEVAAGGVVGRRRSRRRPEAKSARGVGHAVAAARRRATRRRARR